MSLSIISVNNRFSNHLTTPASVTTPVPQQPVLVTGTTGERRMLALYTNAIRNAVHTNTGSESLDGIQSDSAFGAWWQHLYNATQSPVFLEWATLKKIDTSQPIVIDPYSETLTVTLNGERTELHSSAQDPGWREATLPIMTAMKALRITDIAAPTSPHRAPLMLVARFHGEVLLPDRTEQTLARATQLEHNQAFDVLGPDTYVNVKAQSPDVLDQQKRQLGDSINTFSLLQKLRAFDPQIRSLAAYLAHTRIPAHPDSSYSQDTQRVDASLQDLLSAGEWHVPDTAQALNNLIRALAAPALPEPRDGNMGGALAWPVPMSLEDQGELFRIVADNQPPLPGLDSDAVLGSADVLGALMKNVPGSVLNQHEPIAMMRSILESSAAENLGQALKQRMGEVAAHSSPRDLLMTALWVTLDAKSLDDPKVNHVAGFNLAAPEHYGQPLPVIKQRLIEHMKAKFITTAQAAPVAATFVLHRDAPELLVSDIPPNLTYGSMTWLSLKAAVDRIEATSPGASAGMSFKDVIDFDAIDPVTDQAQEIQTATALPAIIDWGKAQGILPLQGPYSPTQLAETSKAVDQQQTQILSAVRSLSEPVPTKRSVALAELKAVLGEGIPLEEKSIRSHYITTDSFALTPSIRPDEHTGSYSLLDIYLSQQTAPRHGWFSSNRAISAAVIRQVCAMANPIEKHEVAFDKFAANLPIAWQTLTKTLISNLPLEDRKNIEWGKLTVYQKGQSERVNVDTRNGTFRGEPRFSVVERERSLIIKTERKGLSTFYEFNPQGNVIRKREDWKDSFKEGLQEPEIRTRDGISSERFTAPAIRRLRPDEADADEERGADDSTALPTSLSSSRSEYLGKLLSAKIVESYELGSLKASTNAITRFDEEENKKNLVRNILLGFLPTVKLVRNLVQGEYLEAASDVVFDLVMSAATGGLGKGAGTAKGLAAVPRPFGQSLLRGFTTGAKSSAQAGGDFLRNISRNVRSRIRGDVTQSGVRLNQAQAATVASRTDLFEGSAKLTGTSSYYETIARFDRTSGKWFAYDPLTNKTYGKELLEFKTVTTTHLDTRWKNVSRKAENGAHGAAFRTGYLSGNPLTVPGYLPGMRSAQVIKLAVTSKTLTPKQIGTLVRQQERLAVESGLNGANTFNGIVRAAGGKVTPMPQVFYLSQAQPLSKGQCAALSHLMAEGVKRDGGKTLINNFYTAAANPSAASSKKFIKTLTELQSRVETPTTFHGAPGVKPQPYSKIADILEESPETKTLMFGDTGHAMNAGVTHTIVDGQPVKHYFFFEPNYGLATFTSAQSLREGMHNVFTSKKFTRLYQPNTTGPANKGFQVTLSEYDGSALSKIGANTPAVSSTYTTPLE